LRAIKPVRTGAITIGPFRGARVRKEIIVRRTESMQVRHLARRPVATASPDTSLADCARRMRDEHVGTLVVVDGTRPVGIVTDRDIVVEAVAQGIDPASLRARDVSASVLVTVAEDDDLVDALARMRENGVRRLAVAGRDGSLTGIVALDDVLAVLAEQFSAAIEVQSAENTRESETRPRR
jgi:predicted transcriptional regulator